MWKFVIGAVAIVAAVICICCVKAGAVADRRMDEMRRQ